MSASAECIPTSIPSVSPLKTHRTETKQSEKLHFIAARGVGGTPHNLYNLQQTAIADNCRHLRLLPPTAHRLPLLLTIEYPYPDPDPGLGRVDVCKYGMYGWLVGGLVGGLAVGDLGCSAAKACMHTYSTLFLSTQHMNLGGRWEVGIASAVWRV